MSSAFSPTRAAGTVFKTAAEEYPIALPWTLPTGDALASVSSVTVTGGTVAVPSSGPRAPTIAGNTVTIWLTAGTVNVTSTIRVVVTTTAGRILAADVVVRVIA